jgi:transposase
MATIIKKRKKGRPYYYAVESARVKGKPRIVWQKYLGTLEAILQRTEAARVHEPKQAAIFQAGGVAGLLGIAQRLDLLRLINELVPKRDQGPSVGHYMLLAAINRALAPCSKAAIGDWYEETVLCRLWRFGKEEFSSQRFWDHMDVVSQEAIDTIQDRLAPRIRDLFGLDARVLLYDTTNFFTFLATSNDRCTVARRGHSKAKRHDLRQVGLALLVSRGFQVPLFHRAYPGNLPDIALFPELARDLLSRQEQALGPSQEATLVFDKGNVTDDAMEQLVVEDKHFVAALCWNREPELMATPLEDFEELAELPGTRAFGADLTLWGKRLRGTVVYTESFFSQQLSGVTQNMVKCQKKLMDLERSLARWRRGKARGKKPTVRGVTSRAKAILSAQFMKELIGFSVHEEKGLPRLRYRVNHDVLDQLTSQRLGRTVLVTDHVDWTAQQVVETYRSLTRIEEAFRNMKNVDFLRWQPAYHWTDQKLAVHAFYCVLGLLLATLARKEAFHAGVDLPLPALLKELAAIREVALIYPPGTPGARKNRVTLSRMSPRQRKLAERLRVGEVLRG